MASDTRSFTPETARHFDRYSVANAVKVKESLPCGCEPYQDVFTYRRWRAQGYQVQRGEKAIRLPLIYARTERDPDTGEERTERRMGRSAVFCRHQVKPIANRRGERAQGRNLGDCPTCGGWGQLHGGRQCPPCDGTGRDLSRIRGER